MHRRYRFLACALATSLLACQPPAPADTTTPTAAAASTPSAPTADPSLAFREQADRWLDESLARHPARGVELGLHVYDGKLPDASPDALAAEAKALHDARARFEAIDPSNLDAIARVERGTLLQSIRGELFELERRRQPWTNPMDYLGALDLTPYISRDYAPIDARAAAVIAIADGTAAYLAQAQANLEAALPRTFVDTALLQVRGTIAFVATDVPAAMQGLTPERGQALTTALAGMTTALKAYEQFLVGRLAAATADYALGPERFAEMLRETQGFDVSLERLEQLGRADLERNLVALGEAAARIDPKRSVAQVIARIDRKRPTPATVLEVATRQAAAMRQFVQEHAIVTIPSDDVAIVKDSPPFMRWNAAFLSGAGVFETAALPSFYYISPPDPSWPKAQQRAYVPTEPDLQFITIHEVWPGHFLHGLHMKANPSRVLRSHWNYAMGEGWAHYTEEMMWQAGVSDDPVVHVGQLRHALLRDVRYLSALGLHTGGMTVAQSMAMFREQAFQDPANARQQANRGTFDPMYLSYTLGKLAILKLRDDVEAKWKAQGKPFTLQAFHDALLGYGAAPLPVIRQALLGDDAGPVL